MRTLAGTIFIASLGLICLSLACSSTSQSPTGATPIPGPDATPPGGRWEGTSTVESLGDDVPECVAASWSAGSVSTVSADVSPSINSIHMVLYSQVNQGCELGGTLFDNRIDAKAWQRDEFDCAMVPSLCGVGCHYRVRTTDWNCAVPAPEIWITDANFRATINPTADRIQGVVLMDYAHSITARPQWKNLRVTARIDLRKTN